MDALVYGLRDGDIDKDIVGECYLCPRRVVHMPAVLLLLDAIAAVNDLCVHRGRIVRMGTDKVFVQSTAAARAAHWQ